jgi:DNA topoisomerase-1
MSANAPIPLVSLQAARDAGLRYVTDHTPGYRRVGRPKRFRYLDAKGKEIRDEKTLARIRSLVLPPAWKNVWISPHANGHIQATGFDKRGRKQYRYHHQWRSVRDATKYDHMIEFAKALPAIRRRVQRDLHLPGEGLPLPKVVAAIVRLLDRTGIRVGNETYKEENGSFGLTTLQDHHAKIRGRTIHLDFNGKSGVRKVLALPDAKLARIVKHCQELPGQDLFQYLDENGDPRNVRDVTSSHVNDYLKQITGEDYTAKDFRTWSGTLCAAARLCGCGRCETDRQAKKNIVDAVKHAAEQLGNRPATCRKYYVHPDVLESYMCRELIDALGDTHKRMSDHKTRGLDPFEKAVLALLEKRRRKARATIRRAA